MSEVWRDDDVGTVLGFLSRLLFMEMFQLRSPYRPHHFQQSPQKSGRPHDPDRCRALGSRITGVGFLFSFELIDTAPHPTPFLPEQPLFTDTRKVTVVLTIHPADDQGNGGSGSCSQRETPQYAPPTCRSACWTQASGAAFYTSHNHRTIRIEPPAPVQTDSSVQPRLEPTPMYCVSF